MTFALAYDLAAEIFPTLDTPHWEAKWRTVGEGLTVRRLMATTCMLLLLLNSQPGRSQWSDMVAYAQRGAQYAKEGAQWMDTKIKWLGDKYAAEERLLRDAALTWKAYNQARLAVTRLESGHIDLSVIQVMPTLDVGNPATNGVKEHVILRPVLRPQDRDIKFRGANIIMPKFPNGGLASLDFEVDRYVTSDDESIATKPHRELIAQADADSWQQWAMVQDTAGLISEDQALRDGPVPYSGISIENQAYYRERSSKLADLCQQALKQFGEDSALYQEQLSAYKDWYKSIQDGTPQKEADDLADELGALDAKAVEQIGRYASAKYQYDLATQHGAVTRKHVKEIADNYNNNAGGPFTNFVDYVGAKAAFDTMAQIGKKTSESPQAPSREATGAQLKNVAIAQATSTETTELVRLKNMDTIEDAANKLRDFAQQKARIRTRIQGKRSQMNAKDDLALARMIATQEMKNMAANGLNSSLPDGQSPVLPTSTANAVPEAIPAAQSADALKKNIDAAKSKAIQTATDGMNAAFESSKKRIGWGGILRPILAAVRDAVKGTSGKTFDLTNIVGTENS